MKRILLFISLIMLTSWSFKPLVDTVGSSEVFYENKVQEITTDSQRLKKLAENKSLIIGKRGYSILN